MCKGVKSGRLQGRAHLKFAFLRRLLTVSAWTFILFARRFTGENGLLDNSFAIYSSSAVVVFFGLPERVPRITSPVSLKRFTQYAAVDFDMFSYLAILRVDI